MCMRTRDLQFVATLLHKNVSKKNFQDILINGFIIAAKQTKTLDNNGIRNVRGGPGGPGPPLAT